MFFPMATTVIADPAETLTCLLIVSGVQLVDKKRWLPIGRTGTPAGLVGSGNLPVEIAGRCERAKNCRPGNPLSVTTGKSHGMELEIWNDVMSSNVPSVVCPQGSIMEFETDSTSLG